MIEGAGFHGAVFDVDGVLVDSPHEHAWRVALDQLFETSWTSIRDATQYTSERFTPEVYRAHISGKPTMSGARAALSYFGVPATDARTEEYARRKQRVMDELLRAGELTAYPDALRFVLAVRGAETPIAAASSSKNAARLLGQIRLDAFADREGLRYDFVRPGITLLDIFDADVSGRDFAHGGKPHPEIFLTAARELGVPADRCFAVEDACPVYRRRRRPTWTSSAWHGPARRTPSLPPTPTSLSRRWTKWISQRSRRAAWRGRRSRRTPSVDDRGGAPNSLERPRPRNERAKSAGPR